MFKVYIFKNISGLNFFQYHSWKLLICCHKNLIELNSENFAHFNFKAVKCQETLWEKTETKPSPRFARTPLPFWLQCGLTCGTIEGSTKSLKPNNKRAFVNFCDKNAVFTIFCDKNAVFPIFATKNYFFWNTKTQCLALILSVQRSIDSQSYLLIANLFYQ